MSRAYEIVGQPNINGKIKVQGSKNSALAIIVASLLTKDVICLENVPNIADVLELLKIIKKLNCSVSFLKNNLIIDASNITYQSLLFPEIKSFRASYYFVGAFLTLFNKVEIFLPGGCKIGKRPIDQHIKGLTSLNVNLCLTNDILRANSLDIIGNEIKLDIASVGATVNLILTSLNANDKTIIKNAAKEPEIIDLVNFLKQIGANIIGEGTNTIIIYPIKKFHKANYKIMPDRIATGTYLLYGALFAKKLTLTNINTMDNYALINALISLGAEMNIRKNSITIYKLNNFDKLQIKTDVYPAFPSDLQQIMSTFLFSGQGISLIEETLFENRFTFLEEISKMNGKFLIIDNKALIIPSKFKSGVVSCNDLRGGAALLLACLMASGTSILKNVEYIERGYENIIEVLQNINVNIKEIELHEA